MDPELMNIIRVGEVSSVNEDNGTVRVKFDDRDDLVSAELPLLDAEYNIPAVGNQVLCLFLSNGLEEGFCLNGFYSDINKPPVHDKNIYYKKFDDGTSIQYNKTTQQLKIEAPNIYLSGKVSASDLQDLQGPAGPQGPIPAHKWDGTKLSFENSDGSYDSGVDLQGPQGPSGDITTIDGGSFV